MQKKVWHPTIYPTYSQLHISIDFIGCVYGKSILE